MTAVLVSVLGLVVGLAAHDLAIQGLDSETPLRPLTGTCPACGTRRGWLRGRCPTCFRVVQREPFVALLAGASALGWSVGFDPLWTILPYLGFLLLTAALLVTDLEQFRIVDRLNLRGSVILALALGATAMATGQLTSFGRGLLGATAYFAGAAAMWLIAKGRGFGAGDVKLAPVLGLFTAYLSWGALGWAVFATAMIGGVVAFIMLAFGAARMKTELPYGPPMILGAWLAILLVGVGRIPLPS